MGNGHWSTTAETALQNQHFRCSLPPIQRLDLTAEAHWEKVLRILLSPGFQSAACTPSVVPPTHPAPSLNSFPQNSSWTINFFNPPLTTQLWSDPSAFWKSSQKEEAASQSLSLSLWSRFLPPGRCGGGRLGGEVVQLLLQPSCSCSCAQPWSKNVQPAHVHTRLSCHPTPAHEQLNPALCCGASFSFCCQPRLTKCTQQE